MQSFAVWIFHAPSNLRGQAVLRHVSSVCLLNSGFSLMPECADYENCTRNEQSTNGQLRLFRAAVLQAHRDFLFARPTQTVEDCSATYQVQPRTAAVSYICKLNQVPGKFLPAKAEELGVPRGPLFGLLKSRQAVTLSDGSTIQPDQVQQSLFDVSEDNLMPERIQL